MPAGSVNRPDVICADPVATLAAAFRQAMTAALGESFADADPLIRASQNPEFGDFQSNAAMGLAKQVGMKPRELGEKIMAALDAPSLIENAEVAGPGFINIRVRSDALAAMLEAMDEPSGSLGVVPDSDTHTVAIDLCGVNVAKQMHVGHLRSTIIGDALARVFERLGRTVHRENHLGDWGLPIAMVLHQLREAAVDLDALTLDDLDAAYRAAQKRCEAEPAAEEGAKATLVRLQRGDAEVVRDWRKLIDVTMRAVYESFDMLGVKLGPENNRGESFYRDMLADVVDAFTRSGIAEEHEGAIVVRFADRERPLLIRKSDGGYLYATTDLAAIRRRVQTLGADRVIYVVDARQRDHFRDVFDAARLIGWDVTPDAAKAELTHIPFGAVLGADRRPLKTRAGENITLKALLVEAIERGTAEVKRRAEEPGAPTHGLPLRELESIGKAVGIGAIKYADLSSDLVRDYVFSFDRMLAFEGNTGPYMQYAHARVCSIFARAGVDVGEGPRDRGMEGSREQDATADPSVTLSLNPSKPIIIIAEPAERRLALALLRYGSVVMEVARSLEPHRLCTYLYELADAYNGFYQQCPVIKAEDDRVRASRLRLCDLVRRVLADGLDLLGIEAPRRM
jgi:arginyl-tRNA synthetase